MNKNVMYYKDNRLIAQGKNIYNSQLSVGEKISPFTTKNGRVAWEVTYVEQIDIDMLHVHIKDYGFLKE